MHQSLPNPVFSCNVTTTKKIKREKDCKDGLGTLHSLTVNNGTL